MASYYKWDVKKSFLGVLQFFSCIYDTNPCWKYGENPGSPLGYTSLANLAMICEIGLDTFWNYYLNLALLNVYLRNIILKRYSQVPQATSFLPDRVHVTISFNDFSSIAARKEGRSSKSTKHTGSFVPNFFKMTIHWK